MLCTFIILSSFNIALQGNCLVWGKWIIREVYIDGNIWARSNTIDVGKLNIDASVITLEKETWKIKSQTAFDYELEVANKNFRACYILKDGGLIIGLYETQSPRPSTKEILQHKCKLSIFLVRPLNK